VRLSFLKWVVGGSQGSGRQEGLGRESWKGDLRAEIVSGKSAEFFDDLRYQNAILPEIGLKLTTKRCDSPL